MLKSIYLMLKSTLTFAGADVIAEKSTTETVNVLKQRQLQLGTLQCAGLRCITQVTISGLASCSMQLELVEWYANSMQRPKLLHSDSSNLQYKIVGSRPALLQHRKSRCSPLKMKMRSICLTSGSPMMIISMETYSCRLPYHPSMCSPKYHRRYL